VRAAQAGGGAAARAARPPRRHAGGVPRDCARPRRPRARWRLPQPRAPPATPTPPAPAPPPHLDRCHHLDGRALLKSKLPVVGGRRHTQRAAARRGGWGRGGRAAGARRRGSARARARQRRRGGARRGARRGERAAAARRAAGPGWSPAAAPGRCGVPVPTSSCGRHAEWPPRSGSSPPPVDSGAPPRLPGHRYSAWGSPKRATGRLATPEAARVREEIIAAAGGSPGVADWGGAVI
jgi:hypothetical protein